MSGHALTDVWWLKQLEDSVDGDIFCHFRSEDMVSRAEPDFSSKRCALSVPAPCYIIDTISICLIQVVCKASSNGYGGA